MGANRPMGSFFSNQHQCCLFPHLDMYDLFNLEISVIKVTLYNSNNFNSKGACQNFIWHSPFFIKKGGKLFLRLPPLSLIERIKCFQSVCL